MLFTTNSLYQFFFKLPNLGWRNSQQLRVLVALVGDPDSVPRIHMVIHSHVELLNSLGTRVCIFTYMQAKYSKSKNISKLYLTF